VAASTNCRRSCGWSSEQRTSSAARRGSQRSPHRRSQRDRIPRNAIARSTEAGRSLRPEGSADAVEKSDSAADGAGLEWLGSWVAGLKHPSASRGETTETVANQSRR
jgi:hypothetical protein